MAEKKKILIIEDEESIRKVLEFRLKGYGFNVVCAGDGDEGLDKAKCEKPDVIILDLILPKKQGEEICKEIRKDADISKTPIIMLTAKGSDVDRIIGRVIGADRYISKPFDMDELLKQINILAGITDAAEP